MTLLGLLASGIFILAIIWISIGFQRSFNVGKKRNEYQNERLDDELIYDPVSGKSYSVEEWQKGIPKDPSNFMRIKSEQEILEHYMEFEQGTERVRNELIRDFGNLLGEKELTQILKVLQQNQLFSHVNYLRITCGSKQSDQQLILLCPLQRLADEQARTQIVGLRYFNDFIGDLTIVPRDIATSLATVITSEQERFVNKSIVRANGVIKSGFVQTICALLESVPFNYEIRIEDRVMLLLCKSQTTVVNYANVRTFLDSSELVKF